jgi:nitroimidazol reductase NimA-like FMN-containing flavoprotein (pyridoxamine 5'-phosphate oxidase superfamily)
MSSETERIIRTPSTKIMPKDELEGHIAEFLKTQNLCTLASCSDNIPRATTLEYYSKGTILYMMPEEGQKMVNIRQNPHVSVAIAAPYTGWLSVKGVQITGEATLITRDSVKEFREGLSVYQWERSAKEIGLKELPESFRLLKVEPHAIEILDVSLKSKGYAPRQLWIP